MTSIALPRPRTGPDEGNGGPGRGLRRRLAVLLSSALVLAAGAATVAASPASADTAPPAGVPATASARPLPTWQINGVAWSQVVVGNTVYVTGSFPTARPPGVAVGGAGQVAAGNIFAYDIRTGNRVTTFSHTLNGQGRAITASPDGTRVYVAGDFTTVDGQARGHVAAFDVATGNLVSGFAPNVNGRVAAITATNSTVYFGGTFSTVNGVSRGNLAAVSATTGAQTGWNPGTDGNVLSMVLTPAQDRVVVGGQFVKLAGVDSFGSGAVSATTGASGTWRANERIRNSGNGAIGSLTTDGTYIYGTGWAFGAGATFEGSFAADPTDGSIHWVYDCLGDTYGASGIGDVVYTVGHAHDCTVLPGGFPDTNPRVRWQRSLAFTKAATQTNLHPDVYGWDYTGLPAPSLLHWYPTWAAGSASGQGQAGWNVTGTSQYVVVAGEFPYVNNTAQQGLTRFGIGATASLGMGPTYETNPARAVPSTTAGVVRPNTVRVAFGTAYDKDNETLKYQVLRDGATPVGPPISQATNFWTLPTLAVTDTSVPAGSHTYSVKITDPHNNTLTSPTSNPVSVSNSFGAYGDAVLASSPEHYWRLGEPQGTIALDSGDTPSDLTTRSGLTWGRGGITSDNTAAGTDGTQNGGGAMTTAEPAPSSFSIEAWFQTTSTTGGKLVGYGNSSTGGSSSYDRHLYMTNDGRLVFGLYDGNTRTVTTSKSFNDGQWHQVVASLDGSGYRIYVDGILSARSTVTTTGQDYLGYWSIGGDSLGGWPDRPASDFFAGSLDEVAIYDSALSQATVRDHYAASGRTVAVPPKPTDAYGAAVYGSEPSLYWRLDDVTGTTVADTMGVTPGTYTGGVTLGQAGVASGKAVGFDGSTGNASTDQSFVAPSRYSEEVWFNTTTTRGGKLIGFSSDRTGRSGGYDRHVWMLDDGRLQFGTWTGQTNIAATNESFNDGQWHHLVATQGPDGMKLYVDGTLRGTNPQTAAQDYTGYWRIGGDTTWGGSSSDWFAGRLDEVAVYDRVLPLGEVQDHFAAGGGGVVNEAPTAAFTSSVTGLTVDVDASSSSDPDGTVASYRWDFGDGASATGRTASHTYAGPGAFQVTLTVTDNRGATGAVTRTVTPVRLPTDGYGAAVAGDDPVLFWRLGEASGPVAQDAMGRHGGTYIGAGHAFEAAGAVATGGGAVGFDGDSSAVASADTFDNPSVYSEELWFRTTTTAGGKLIGFGNANSGTSNNYDRHVYMLPSGELQFGTWTGQMNVIGSPTALNDGAWHHVVASQDASGMKLFVDGQLVASNTQPSAQAYTGYWRVGGDTSWAGVPYFAGTIDEVAVYDKALTAGQVTAHFTAGGGQLPNQSPTAGFTATVDGKALAVDGSSSQDPDGSIASWAWDFGDGSTGTGRTASHTYATAGTRTVTLTVTDDRGATATTTRDVTATNRPPTAAFTATSDALTASFDASGSGDPDGSVVSYAWDFGDGATGTGRTATRTYASAGTRTVTLTVTDDEGATASTTRSVTVSANQAPTASFTAAVDGLTATLDASGSSDPDGSVASYAWDFGDSTTGTGATTSHTYTATGSYTVRLTVTDNRGATDTTTRTVVASGLLAADAFARTVSRGLGTADQGGAWTLQGSTSLFGVANGVGSLQMVGAGKGSAAALGGVSSMGTDLGLVLAFDKAPTGGGQYGYVTARGTLDSGYRTKIRVASTGAVTVWLTAVVNGTETDLTSTTVQGLNVTAGTKVAVRMQTFGTSPTTVRAKVWAAGGTEPTAWLVSSTDSRAALQVAGGIAVRTYLSGSSTNAPVTMLVDDLVAKPVGN